MFSKKKFITDILKETMMLKLAQSSNVTPKRPKIQIFKKNNKFIIGIVMEHIEGRTFNSKYPLPNEYTPDEYQCTKDGTILSKRKYHEDMPYCDEYFSNKLKKYNVEYQDYNAWNVLITKDDKIKLVDFSPKHRYAYSSSINTTEVKKVTKQMINHFL